MSTTEDNNARRLAKIHAIIKAILGSLAAIVLGLTLGWLTSNYLGL